MSTTVITQTEKDKLYTQVLHVLGMPVRGVELKEEQLDTFLELSLSEYEQFVNDWLIESQWSSLAGLDIDNQSLTRAFTTRSLDYETQFTHAYSKIVGLQAGGFSELKKDSFMLTGGTQTYIIPAGREINELLWFTRAILSDSIIDPYFSSFGGVAPGGMGGFSQIGSSGSYFMMPAFDLLLRMGDRNLKNRIFSGDLTYRITAGPAGTKVVHLYNVPGGKFDFGEAGRNYQVWYWYYETTDDNRNECLEKNKDIVKLPSDVDIDELKWSDLNRPAQNWVRKYFIAYAKEGLGRIWGKFGGDFKIPESDVKLSYTELLTEGKDEKSKLVEELMQRLERLRPDKILERKAGEAENLNKSLKFRAMPSPINII